MRAAISVFVNEWPIRLPVSRNSRLTAPRMHREHKEPLRPRWPFANPSFGFQINRRYYFDTLCSPKFQSNSTRRSNRSLRAYTEYSIAPLETRFDDPSTRHMFPNPHSCNDN